MSATPTGLQARTETTVKVLSQQIVRETSMPLTRARIKTCIEINISVYFQIMMWEVRRK